MENEKYFLKILQVFSKCPSVFSAAPKIDDDIEIKSSVVPSRPSSSGLIDCQYLR